jgi:hypothetical protein
MFPLRAGRDMVQMVPNATWLPIAGMGHDLPPPLWPVLVAAITRHADRAESRAESRAARRTTGFVSQIIAKQSQTIPKYSKTCANNRDSGTG